MASVSFTAWTISQLPALRAILFPVEDLHVVSLNSLHGGIVVNQGDKEVFLSHIMLKMNRRAPWGAQRFPINESLPPGKFVKVPVPRSDDFGEGGWVRGIQPSVLEKFIDVAIDDTRCFHIVFFSADDPLFRELKGFAGPSLNTLAVTGYLEYRSIYADAFSRIAVQSSAVIRTSSASDCRAKIPKASLQ